MRKERNVKSTFNLDEYKNDLDVDDVFGEKGIQQMKERPLGHL